MHPQIFHNIFPVEPAISFISFLIVRLFLGTGTLLTQFTPQKLLLISFRRRIVSSLEVLTLTYISKPITRWLGSTWRPMRRSRVVWVATILCLAIVTILCLAIIRSHLQIVLHTLKFRWRWRWRRSSTARIRSTTRICCLTTRICCYMSTTRICCRICCCIRICRIRWNWWRWWW